MDSLPFSRIHEFLGEAVTIVDVVSTTAPQPVPRQVLRASSPTAATGGQLALAACSAHGIHHPSCAHRIREGGLSAACGRGCGVTRLPAPCRGLDLVVCLCVRWGGACAPAWRGGTKKTSITPGLCSSWRRLRELNTHQFLRRWMPQHTRPWTQLWRLRQTTCQNTGARILRTTEGRNRSPP